MSPISSRSKCRRKASSNLPLRPLRSAPCKAPGRRRRSSDSSRVSGMAAIFRRDEGAPARRLAEWIAWAQELLAVPVRR